LVFTLQRATRRERVDDTKRTKWRSRSAT
jgi:hypothetical protein